MFRFTSIKEYQDLLLTGKIRCVDVVQYYLTQIKQQESLNAFLEVFPEEAMLRAEQLDQDRASGKALGRLHGVVIGIKDVLCYKGHTVSAASKILENYTAIYSATAIEKIIAEGAIIIGRQNCDEFAMGSSNENSAYGVVKNAANNALVPGGSSGGSAVAVQAGMCMVSLGSDTGGSVRQPADFCGVVGLKPSYGLVSRYGLIAYASSFDQIGVFSNNVNDAALVLEVIGGGDDFDSTVSTAAVPLFSQTMAKPTHQKRIAYFKEMLEHDGLDPQIRKQMEDYITDLRLKGYQVEAVDFSLLSYLVPTYYVLTTAEASSNLSRFDGIRFGHRTNQKVDDLTDVYKISRTEGFGQEVQRRILLGSFVLSAGFFDAYFTKAQQVRQQLVDLTNQVFASFDFIITPTVPTTAFEIGAKHHSASEMFLADIYTVFANLVGVPGISIPLFTHSNGMPFGLQIMAKHFDESNMLSFAHELMNQKN